MSDRALRLLRQWVWVLPTSWLELVIALAAGLLLAVGLSELPMVLTRLGYPYQLDDSEGVILGETLLLLKGIDIFQPVTPDFFSAAPYPPLFYWLLTPLLAAGLAPFPAARTVTLLTTLGLALLAGSLIARRGGRPVAGLLTAGLWLAPNLVTVWSVRVRPDLLALTINLMGLALVWRYGLISHQTTTSRDRSRWLAISVLLAAAAFATGFYFKHTALAAPAAAGLWLLLRRPLPAIGLGIAYLVSVLVPFGLLNLMTNGGFSQHLISFHRSWFWHNYVDLALPFVGRYWPLGLLPALALAVDLVRRQRPSLPSIYLLMAGIVSLGGGTHGGNHNHLLETLLAAALANGDAISRLVAAAGRRPSPASPVPDRQPTRGVALGWLVAPAATALMVWTLLTEPATGRAWLAPDLRPPSERERLGWQQVIPVVASEDGPVYSDNVGLLLLAGQPIHYSDPFTLAGAVEAGLWSDAALVAAVQQRRFSLIALRYDVGRLRAVPTDITPALLAAIREHYVVADRNVMILYRPR